MTDGLDDSPHTSTFERSQLERFREFAGQHVADFLAARDRVRHLLAPAQPYLTGIAREDLLRGFLRRLLPEAVSIDSGVVYGFEKIPNSRQIDVLVWHSAAYPAVFRADTFVILPPEAVIAAISVKTSADRRDYEDTVDNLQSLVNLDIGYREAADLPPIEKFGFFYDAPTAADSARTWLASNLRSQLLAQAPLLPRLKTTLESIDPHSPTQEDVWFLQRLLPSLFVHIADPPTSFYRGWGPPGRTVSEARLDRLHLRPFLYSQDSRITSPLEKMAYLILRAVFERLGTKGSSIVAAWGDFHPQFHFRVGDALEVKEETGLAILENTDV